jgi:AraC family ethanolamine operon transcriptional activator
VSLEDLATAVGVSERTVRTAFHDYFGVGPRHYLNLRQLHLIRRTLQGPDPGMATVSAVATHFGVWELGRFAQRYRTLFGELPSATLKRGRLVGACR